MKILKLYLFIQILLSTSALRAQSTYNDTLDMLVKTWMVKEVPQPSFASKEDEDGFKDFINSLRLEFKKDGKMVAIAKDETINGRWTYNNSKREITLTMDADEPAILQLVELTPTLFKFSNKTVSGGGVPSGTFVPAK